MKIAVRYLSRGGNTRAVAEAIAKAAEVKAEQIDVPLGEAVDILFLGSGVYAFNVDRKVKDYLEALNPSDVKTIAAFSTGSTMSGTGKITAAAKAMGIPVCTNELPIKMGVKNTNFLGGEGNITLSKKQISLIEDFVKQAIGEQRS